MAAAAALAALASAAAASESAVIIQPPAVPDRGAARPQGAGLRSGLLGRLLMSWQNMARAGEAMPEHSERRSTLERSVAAMEMGLKRALQG